MVDSDGRPESIVRQVPLDRLAAPEHDVRESRPASDVEGLARSMEANGQIQAAIVYPDEFDTDDVEDYREEAALGALFENAGCIRLVDGMCRRAAARQLGWPTLRCEVFRKPPDDETLVSVAANIERVEMDDIETIRALRDYRERTGATLEEISEKVGYSPSALSNFFSALEAPSFLVDSWQNPDSFTQIGHVLEIMRMPEESGMQRVLQDVEEWNRPVSHTRDVCRNVVREQKQEAQDQRNREEKQMDGQSEAAHRETSRRVDRMENPDPCMICGDRHQTHVSLPVCSEDYGTIKHLEQEGVPLMVALQGDRERHEPAPDERQAPPGQD